MYVYMYMLELQHVFTRQGVQVQTLYQLPACIE